MLSDPMTPIILLLLGLVMFFIEMAVIPGFGVAGIAGIVLLVAGSFSAWSAYGATMGVVVMFGSLFAAIALVYFFFKSRSAQRLVREEKIKGDSSKIPSMKYLIGKEGVTTTTLRPSGIAEIDGERYDVVCEGEVLDKGTTVVVVRLDTNSIVVDKKD